MKRLVFSSVAVAIVILLSSCGLLSDGRLTTYENDTRIADSQMQLIADAVNDHDAAALEALFSPHALELAAEIDTGLDYLLSFFPNGVVSWERDTLNSEGGLSNPKVLKAYYTLSADGRDYSLFFADFTEDDENPDRVGVYAIGVTPLLNDLNSGPESLFHAWAGSIKLDESGEMGYAGVYIPDYDSPEVSDYAMKRIVQTLDGGDRGYFAERFSLQVRAALGATLTDDVDALFAFLPEGEIAWEPIHDGPVARSGPDGAGETVLLLSRYPVSSHGQDFWVAFAYFPVNESDPRLEGIYALGIARRTGSADSLQEEALFAWIDAFDVTASTPPGIFIAE
jgi:hypothetical protein